MSASSHRHQPARGRPSVARAIAIDRLIIDTARQLFLAGGFDAVTMEQVVAAAGISKGTLYSRYASKEALFSAVIVASVEGWSAIASRNDHLLTGSIEQRLRQHARTIAASLQWPDVMAFQRLIVAVQDRFPELSRIMYESGARYIVELIARDIAAAALADGVPASDPQSIARLLVASLAGYQQQARASASDELGDLDQFAQRVVDLLMAARTRW